jgi:hypothetical protein
MECIANVLTTLFRTNSCPSVCIMSGKGDVHVDEELEGKKKGEVMSFV